MVQARIETAASAGRAQWRELTDELADAIDRARSLTSGAADGHEPSIDFDYTPRDSADRAVGLSARDVGRILDNLLTNAVSAIQDERPTHADGDKAPAAFADGSAESSVATAAGGPAAAWVDTPPTAADEPSNVTAVLTRTPELVRLTVEDTGPGMPEDFIPVALDRFTRADASRAAHRGGGLGLAIVAALVASAHGTITLANIPGAGLRVAIELPLVPEESPES